MPASVSPTSPAAVLLASTTVPAPSRSCGVANERAADDRVADDRATHHPVTDRRRLAGSRQRALDDLHDVLAAPPPRATSADSRRSTTCRTARRAACGSCRRARSASAAAIDVGTVTTLPLRRRTPGGVGGNRRRRRATRHRHRTDRPAGGGDVVSGARPGARPRSTGTLQCGLRAALSLGERACCGGPIAYTVARSTWPTHSPSCSRRRVATSAASCLVDGGATCSRHTA